MPLFLGANRGIGLKLLQTFVDRGWTATGTVRPMTITDPSVDDLKATGARILEVDYTDERTIAEAAKQYGSGPLVCLVNCGGMLDKVPTFKAIYKFLGVGPQPFDWDAGSGERILEMFNIMSVGPYLAIKHFMPNLKKSSVPKIAAISSEFGCISTNERGGFLGYRMAKAALNQQYKTIAQVFKEDPKMIFLTLEPGYVATRLTSWKGEDDIEKCVQGMYEVIDGAKQSDSGFLFNYHGKKLEF